MRAGLSTIQQTLTPEAASVLNLSIAEAGRRNHGQTTPLHVAATLLASPSGFLRQACIRSHPNSSHPLQCRALELCFSVALERLPTAQNSGAGPAGEPPISNALMAALKRAQAHQRRGCPEQQQQPLLAVKVELEQLIISILDDPSVSRVMREASFSSPAVKATIEQSLNSQPHSVNPPNIGIGFRPSSSPASILNRNMYLNPRLQQGNTAQSGQNRGEEVTRVTDVLLKTRKRNPVLVGDSEPEAVKLELVRRIEKGELGEGPLKNVQVIPVEKELLLDKAQIPGKIKELGGLIEARMRGSEVGGIILDLGDLKWLVEQPVSIGGGVPVVSEMGKMAVAEMAALLARFGDGGSGRLWMIGTATCETYLRCQVYHPSMENDWDLQALPIASRTALHGMFPRMGANGILSNSVESMSPLKSFPAATNSLPRRVSENLDPAQRLSCCPQCTEHYEQELAKLVAKEYEKSSSESKLPQWLQSAKVPSSDAKTTDQSQAKVQEMMFKQKSQELQKKWSGTCSRLHPSFHQNLGAERSGPTALSMPGLYNPKLLGARQAFQPKLRPIVNHGESLQLNTNPLATLPSEPTASPPRSPVRTDLVLGPTKTKTSEATQERTQNDLLTEFLPIEKLAKMADTDSYKKLLKGLIERAWWQPEAASAVATIVTRCKLGNGKRRGAGTRGDMWLLFAGPDRAGKKKMAAVLSEQMCGTNPTMVYFGSRRDDEELEMNFRGKTALDRIVEAVRRNPFSVIMLEDIDEADMLVRGSIKRAMERGRLADSHGREISLGNVIFILTAAENQRKLSNNGSLIDEKKLASIASGGWQLKLSIGGRGAKRRSNWLQDEERHTRPRKETGSGLSFDLNLLADAEDDRTDGSHNSSDVTIDHEEDLGLETRLFSITSVPNEIISSVEDTIVFKPVEIAAVRREIKTKIRDKFSIAVDEKGSIEFEEEALEKILAGVWLGRAGLGDWLEKVMVPSFQQLKAHLPSGEAAVVWLEPDGDSDDRSAGNWLPSEIRVNVEGV